jgi:hypothetical protein
MSDFETETRVRLDMLEKEATGLRMAVTALAVQLCQQAPGSEKQVRELLAATALNAEVTEGAAAALPVRDIIRHLAPLLDGGLPPAGVLLVQALQVADAGVDRRPALGAWLEQASDAELTEDMLQLLRKYGIPVQDDDGSAKSS